MQYQTRQSVSGRRPTVGFTLIELTVALVIVVLLAAMIIPRFTGTERRHFERIAEQVGDLMIVYAQRDRMSNKTIGLFHDAERNWLTVVLQEEEGVEGTDEYGWRVDPIITPVKLPDTITDVRGYEDGRLIDITHWPITNRPNQTRPTVEIEIASDEFSARVQLQPHAVSPNVLLSTAPQQQRESVYQPIDLNSAGRNREEW